MADSKMLPVLNPKAVTVLIGQEGSGKTHTLSDLFTSGRQLFGLWDNVHLAYARDQDVYDQWAEHPHGKRYVKHKGLTELMDLLKHPAFPPSEANLLIIDDLMGLMESSDVKALNNFMSLNANHSNVKVVMLMHNHPMKEREWGNLVNKLNTIFLWQPTSDNLKLWMNRLGFDAAEKKRHSASILKYFDRNPLETKHDFVVLDNSKELQHSKKVKVVKKKKDDFIFWHPDHLPL